MRKMPPRVYTVAEKIQFVKWYFQGNSAKKIVNLFITANADRPVPTRSTVLRIIKRFETWGCFVPCKQCYQPPKQQKNKRYIDICAFVEASNHCSSRQIAAEINVNARTILIVLGKNGSNKLLCLICSCAVRSCTSKVRKDRKNFTGITFHSFPEDLKRRNIWINFAERGKWVPSKYSRLCSKHFLEEHIDRTSLCCVRLRHNAIPTIGGPQDLQLTLPVKQEQDNPFNEEQQIEIEENFLSNTIKAENYEICNEIKTEFVSIKEENDEDLEADYSQN